MMMSSSSNSAGFESPPDHDGIPAMEAAAMSYAGDEDMEDTSTSAIEQVKQRHEERLLTIDGVTGVGIGQDELGDDVIIVYVMRRDVQTTLPNTLDGVAIRVEVTGPIDAH